MRAREPGLQAPSNLAGSKIKNTHFSPLINSFSEISNIGKRTHHVSCKIIYCYQKLIKGEKWVFLILETARLLGACKPGSRARMDEQPDLDMQNIKL